jgi:hypothetical protein
MKRRAARRTPIAYLDALEFKTFVDRDADGLPIAVERIGKVPENQRLEIATPHTTSMASADFLII